MMPMTLANLFVKPTQSFGSLCPGHAEAVKGDKLLNQPGE
jgi:hypothetical protein